MKRLKHYKSKHRGHMESIHLFLNKYVCNSNCICCPTIRQNCHEIETFEEIIQGLKKVKFLQRIYITGGEPTIHPDFFRILDWIKKEMYNPKITILSNGRIFYYNSFVNRILGYNITEFYLSLRGLSEIVHDYITRSKGSYNQTIGGINNLMKRNKKVIVCLIINKINIYTINKDLDLFLKKFKNNYPIMDLRFIDLIGEAEINRKELNIKFSSIIPPLSTFLDSLINRGIKVNISGMAPLCLLPKEYHKYVIKQSEQKIIDIKNRNKEFIAPGDQFIFLDRCKNCQYRNRCNGIYINYLKYNGEEEFKSISRKDR